MSSEEHRPGRFVPSAQVPPEPRRVTETVVVRFDHVYEVDPALMREFPQQAMPAWDTRRIVAARLGHLDAVHAEFADEVLLAGEGPDEDI